MVRSGRARQEQNFATHIGTIASTTRASVSGLSLSLSSFSSFFLLSPPLFSFSVAHLLNCLLARSSSFVVPFLSLSLSPSLYIPHLLFPLYPRYLLSSLTFAPFHRRHPLWIVSFLPRSLSLHLSLSPYSRSPAPSAFSVRRRLFGPFPSYSLLSSPMVSFTFFSTRLVEQLH